ncbi:thiamine transport system substrate-binding protein [Oceanospirillum multiglobuliferum]|nr:thiamine ABC transporter substrate binding subunit [Oceanospirillum multiglobuliferum]SKA11072.1 thiamine transport system substrate-binding protein [Oceanospirillum multiglobuliferum]
MIMQSKGFKTQYLLVLSLVLGFFSSSVFAKTLNVYTYDSFVSDWGPGPKLKAAFEAQCHCDLNFIAVEDGVSILNRVRIEGKKSKADVLLGLDNGLIEEARRLGLVQAHGLKTDQIKAELEWQDRDFMPFDYGYFAFIYDSRKITAPAQSLDELIQSDAQIIYQDPRTSTPGQGLMTWINAVYGESAAESWQQLSKHTVTVTKGWWEAYSMFLEGGSDYVLSYTTSPAYHAIVEGHEYYKAALFAEGHVAQVEVAAIAANSAQVELAQQFVAFLISPEAQRIIPTTNWMLPVIDGVDLPAAFDQLIKPQQIGFSNEEISAQRKQWLQQWRQAASH